MVQPVGGDGVDLSSHRLDRRQRAPDHEPRRDPDHEQQQRSAYDEQARHHRRRVVHVFERAGHEHRRIDPTTGDARRRNEEVAAEWIRPVDLEGAAGIDRSKGLGRAGAWLVFDERTVRKDELQPFLPVTDRHLGKVPGSRHLTHDLLETHVQGFAHPVGERAPQDPDERDAAE